MVLNMVVEVIIHNDVLYLLKETLLNWERFFCRFPLLHVVPFEAPCSWCFFSQSQHDFEQELALTGCFRPT